MTGIYIGIVSLSGVETLDLFVVPVHALKVLPIGIELFFGGLDSKIRNVLCHGGVRPVQKRFYELSSAYPH